MSQADNIKHFLVTYDIAAARADVRPFGADYDAALAAYDQAERDTRNDSNVEVVLLSADSLETIERTHSSYFDARTQGAKRIASQLRPLHDHIRVPLTRAGRRVA